RKERQRPDTLGPSDLREQHTAKPTQPAGFDEMGLRRAHRIAVDAFGSDFVTASSLDGVVNTKDERPGRDEGRNQQAKQKATGAQRRPDGAIQNAMVSLEVFVCTF